MAGLLVRCELFAELSRYQGFLVCIISQLQGQNLDDYKRQKQQYLPVCFIMSRSMAWTSLLSSPLWSGVIDS